jgi:hypothetical protein
VIGLPTGRKAGAQCVRQRRRVSQPAGHGLRLRRKP